MGQDDQGNLEQFQKKKTASERIYPSDQSDGAYEQQDGDDPEYIFDCMCIIIIDKYSLGSRFLDSGYEFT